MIEEIERLSKQQNGPVPSWSRWGPFVSERAWGTVREDYSANGDAWSYLPFDKAHEKAFRWGDDAIAGWCDRYQLLLFAPVLWNGKDPILKERLFGLSSPEGNHGEDVKEAYFHLDALPSHAYMRYLYRYPQNEFPYDRMREEAAKRSTHDQEFELVDSGIFEGNRYTDVTIEYAKIDADEWAVRIELHNAGAEESEIHLLLQLWWRNRWAWSSSPTHRPTIKSSGNGKVATLLLDDTEAPALENLTFPYRLGQRFFHSSGSPEILLTQNDSSLPGDAKRKKDAFHRFLVQKESDALERSEGTKAALHHHLKKLAPGEKRVVYGRMSRVPLDDPFHDLEALFVKRRQETERYYNTITPSALSEERKSIFRKALSGILWSKQIYLYDVNQWLKGDNPVHPPPDSRLKIRNQHWRHLNSMRILTMPDKWEYPYFCAWDQAFHALTLSVVDLEAAKEQLWLLFFDQFQHPNGELPSCEWEFSDKNPPVQGWTLWRLYEREKKLTGKGDRQFLERCFHKLLINFAWWVNKVDSSGNNVFEGGFLGLDNITLIDRSQKLPGGVNLEQSDGTGWMANFCLALMRISMELALENPVYESLATKFFEHFVYIASAMKKVGNRSHELWSNRDGFFYDVLTYPDGNFAKFRVRSAVGIIPLFAVELLTPDLLERLPAFRSDFSWFLRNRTDLVNDCITPLPGGRYLLSLVNQQELRSMVGYIWNPEEFRSEFGLRSLSRYHKSHPFVFEGKEVGYEPAESVQRIKGGNSNWRGPVWMNINYLLIHSLRRFHEALGDGFTVAAPGEEPVTLETMARSFSERLVHIFERNEEGKRAFWGEGFPYATHPDWQEHLLFYEYYNPETGQGLGAAHQTGWSALVANLLEEWG